MLKVPEHEVVRAVERLGDRVKELQKRGSAGPDRGTADELVAGADELSGVRVVVEAVDALDAKALLELSEAVRQKLGALGMEIVPREQQTAAALATLHKAEAEKWWPVIKAANIQTQ